MRTPFDELTDDDKRALGEALAEVMLNPRIAAAVGFVVGIITKCSEQRDPLEDVIAKAWPSLLRKKWGSA